MEEVTAEDYIFINGDWFFSNKSENKS
jgi:hypothetical protein